MSRERFKEFYVLYFMYFMCVHVICMCLRAYLVCCCVSMYIPWRPWRAEVYFSISISNKYRIYKNLQGLQGHHGHTHNQTKTRLKTLSRKVFRGLQGIHIFDRYTNKIEKPKIFSKIISPGEKNMNFVKIFFSGEHRILSVWFRMLRWIHKPCTKHGWKCFINQTANRKYFERTM